MFARMLLVSIIALCASCKTGTWYKEPSSGPIAHVTIRTTATDYRNIGVVLYKGSEYLETKGEVLGVLNSIAAGIPFTDTLSFAVAADQEFRFSTRLGGNAIVNPETLKGWQCQTHVAFVPKAGLRYELLHAAPPGGCSVELFQVEMDGSKKKLSDLRQLKACFDPGLVGSAFKDNYCAPGFSYE